MGQLTNFLVKKAKDGISNAQAKFEAKVKDQQEKAERMRDEARERQARHLAEVKAEQERDQAIRDKAKEREQAFMQRKREREASITYRDNSVHIGSNHFQENSFGGVRDVKKQYGSHNNTTQEHKEQSNESLLTTEMVNHQDRMNPLLPSEIRTLALESAKRLGITNRMAIKNAEIVFKQKYGFKDYNHVSGRPAPIVEDRDEISTNDGWLGLAQDQPLSRDDMVKVNRIEQARKRARFEKQLYAKYADCGDITVEVSEDGTRGTVKFHGNQNDEPNDLDNEDYIRELDF